MAYAWRRLGSQGYGGTYFADSGPGTKRGTVRAYIRAEPILEDVVGPDLFVEGEDPTVVKIFGESIGEHQFVDPSIKETGFASGTLVEEVVVGQSIPNQVTVQFYRDATGELSGGMNRIPRGAAKISGKRAFIPAGFTIEDSQLAYINTAQPPFQFRRQLAHISGTDFYTEALNESLPISRWRLGELPDQGQWNVKWWLKSSTGTTAAFDTGPAPDITYVSNVIDWTDYNPLGDTDFYIMTAEGYFVAPYSETFTFTLLSDDSTRLWIDGTLKHSGNAYTAVTFTHTLVAGQAYHIRIEHEEHTSAEYLKLEWQSASLSKQLVGENSTITAVDEMGVSNGTLSRGPQSSASIGHQGLNGPGAYYIDARRQAKVAAPHNSLYNGPDGFAVETWVKRPNQDLEFEYNPIVSKAVTGSSWTGKRFIAFLYSTSSQKTVYADIGGGTTNGGVLNTAGPIPQNQWIQYVLVYDPTISRATIYIDGEYHNHATVVGSSVDSSGDFVMGAISGFNGSAFYMTETSYFNRPLTADEVKKHYKAGSGRFYAAWPTTALFVEGGGAAAVEEGQPAFIEGIYKDVVSQPAFIQIETQVDASHNAFIEGIYKGIVSVSAYMYGLGVDRPSQPAFIQIETPNTLSRPSYIAGIDTWRGSKNAFLYGIGRERLVQHAFIQIETPLTDSQGAYIQIETPTTSLKRAFIVASAFVLDEDQRAYIHGLGVLRSTKHSFIQIETPVTDSQACFLVGPPVESTVGAFTMAPWVQPAYIQIETPLFDLQGVYTRGHQTVTVFRNTYLRGATGISASKPAFIQIITPRQEQKLAYIVTVEPRTVSKTAFVRGIETATPSRNAYMFGHHITAPSAIGAYIRIGEPIDGSKLAFIQIENINRINQPSFVRGLDSMPLATKRCWIDSRYRIEATPQPAFIQIQTPVTTSQGCFIQIETIPSITPKRAYIRNVGILEQPNLCYTLGGYIEREAQFAYVHIHTGMNAPKQSCYVEYRPTISGSVMCYIFETGLNQVRQICYLNGDWQGAVDVTKPAFIHGTRVHRTVVNNDQHCYINGVIRTATDNQLAFIVNYGLIAYWKMDDGNTDPGAAGVNDYSTIDNDGEMINWPQWIEDPFAKDCP